MIFDTLFTPLWVWGKYILNLLPQLAVIFIFFYGLWSLLSRKGKAQNEQKIALKSYEKRYYEALTPQVREFVEKKDLTALKKAQKAAQKEKGSCLYVIDFDGDMQASNTVQLAETTSCLLPLLRSTDKVLVRVKSSGGLVPHYGYAASQLSRLRSKASLTVAIDHIAASGGYLMACVAHEIIAAPFAIVGSIGVVGLVPNVHPLLKNHGIDVHEHTAGEYKRSLSPWAAVTPEKVQRYEHELSMTHELFQEFVQQYRPNLEPEVLQTGEYRYAARSVGDTGLVDKVQSSDDFIAEHLPKYHVIFVTCREEKSVWQRLSGALMHFGLATGFLRGPHA